MTTVLIADDQALVRVGLRKILEAEPEMSVVGEAGDGDDAVAEVRRLRPDVVLMDIRMGRRSLPLGANQGPPLRRRSMKARIHSRSPAAAPNTAKKIP